MADFGAIGGFDANQVKPSEAFSAIPAGDYDAIIVESGWEENAKKTGKFLKLKLQIINGQYQNRVLWDRLNLLNPNDQAVQIAKGTLSAICRAVGIMTPRDSAELHGRPLKITVKVGDDGKGNKTNEVKGYKSRHVGGPTGPAAPPAPPAPGPQYQPPAYQQAAAPPPQYQQPAQQYQPQPAQQVAPYQAPPVAGQATPW